MDCPGRASSRYIVQGTRSAILNCACSNQAPRRATDSPLKKGSHHYLFDISRCAVALCDSEEGTRVVCGPKWAGNGLDHQTGHPTEGAPHPSAQGLSAAPIMPEVTGKGRGRIGRRRSIRESLPSPTHCRDRDVPGMMRKDHLQPWGIMASGSALLPSLGRFRSTKKATPRSRFLPCDDARYGIYLFSMSSMLVLTVRDDGC